jgi:hypothetical protein
METESVGYPERTRMNVLRSDATVRFAVEFMTPGELLTLRYIKVFRKLALDIVVSPSYEILMKPIILATWLDAAPDIQVLNIAGNGRVAIESVVENFLLEALGQAVA